MKIFKIIGCIVLLALVGCGGGGENSTLGSVSPPNTALAVVPVVPTVLSATATSSSQINLAWADNSNNETGFKIERKTGLGGTYILIATAAANATSYNNTGLTASTAYYYRIRSTNGVGDSGYTNVVNSTTFANSGVGTGTIKLPKTGQTTCYNESGSVIACAGTGQDGELQIGVAWPNPRFVDNSIVTPADQTVTDQLTGLIWTKDANLMLSRDPLFDTDTIGGTVNDGGVAWQHALDYVKKLNTENYLGHNDWRLPNINELGSLFNKQEVSWNTWLNSQGFNNAVSSYWSSSFAGDSPKKLAFAIETGRVYTKSKGLSFYVWPVRSGLPGFLTLPKTGQTSCYDADGASRSCSGTGEDGDIQSGTIWPNPRFTDNSSSTTTDLTVTDNLSGLIWTKNGYLTAGTWQQALDYIKTINSSSYLGHNDWRLPNINELESLINKQQSSQATWLNTQGFTNVQAYDYWSSSHSWCVDMVYGKLYYKNTSVFNVVWPVRGGL